MSIKITIPNTSSDTLTFGSANTPTAAQIAGIDSGSSNGQLAIYTTASGTSTERVRVDASGNVGIGTASPSGKLNVISGSVAQLIIGFSGTSASYLDSDLIVFRSALTSERMRIDSSGNLLVGGSSVVQNSKVLSVAPLSTKVGIVVQNTDAFSGTMYFAGFANSAGNLAGYIAQTGTTTVSYTSVSDYRLKENVVPMSGALSKVQALKPCTYKWKSDGTSGQGFIAHELQAIIPDCVVGEKDAVDSDGNPKYQGVDTSFLVATLTAAIQEQQALITALTARIEILEKK